MKKGTLIIISAPSGTGKTTIIKHLLKKIPHAAVVVTDTTRDPRPGETEGVHYYFIDTSEFEKKLLRGEFVEHARYAGELYGIERRELETKLAEHDLVFVTPEVQGKRQLEREKISQISIFVEPDDLNTLKLRLAGRKTLSDDEITHRLDTAAREMAFAKEYDYRVVNHEGRLDRTVQEIMGILDKKELL